MHDVTREPSVEHTALHYPWRSLGSVVCADSLFLLPCRGDGCDAAQTVRSCSGSAFFVLQAHATLRLWRGRGTEECSYCNIRTTVNTLLPPHHPKTCRENIGGAPLQRLTLSLQGLPLADWVAVASGLSTTRAVPRADGSAHSQGADAVVAARRGAGPINGTGRRSRDCTEPLA